jgi:hypothetical protein
MINDCRFPPENNACPNACPPELLSGWQAGVNKE